MFNPFMRYSSYYNPWQGGRGYNNLWRGGRGFLNGLMQGVKAYAENVWQGNYEYVRNMLEGRNGYANGTSPGAYGYNFPQGAFGYNTPQSSYGYSNGFMQGGNGYNMPRGYGYMNSPMQSGYKFASDQWRVKRDAETPPQGSYGFTNIPSQGGTGFTGTPPQSGYGFAGDLWQGSKRDAEIPRQGGPGFTGTPPQGNYGYANTPPQSGQGYADSRSMGPRGAGRPADNTARSEIKLTDNGPGPFIVNIGEAAKLNNAFRMALWTGDNLQVTLMSVSPGEDIGFEAHTGLDRFIRIEEGSGILVMGDKKENLDFHATVSAGDAFVIPDGKWHNLVNSGEKLLKLFSVYTQPLHPFGVVQTTKAEAKPAENEKQEIVYVK